VADFAYRLSELLGSASIAVLTAPGGYTNGVSCPLLIQRVDESATVWLLSSQRAVHALALGHEHPLALVIIPTQPGRHLVLHGRGFQPADGSDTAAAHWHDGFRAWFPKGPEDPDLLLLKIPIVGADCWDGVIHRRIEPVPAA